MNLRELQPQLIAIQSNSMRHNDLITHSNGRKFTNSPIAFTMGHEIRKAAITMSNLLPIPRREVTAGMRPNVSLPVECIDAKDMCLASPNLAQFDGIKIPASLIEKARGIAIITCVKAGLMVAGEVGTGLVIARLPSGEWSAPSAIGSVGISWGALAGVSLCDHVFLLMSDDAVALFGTSTSSVQLGADVAVAAGPLGRAMEADFGTCPDADFLATPVFSYSFSKGLYIG